MGFFNLPFDFFDFDDTNNILEEKFEELMDKAYNPTIQDDDITQLSANEQIFSFYTFLI